MRILCAVLLLLCTTTFAHQCIHGSYIDHVQKKGYRIAEVDQGIHPKRSVQQTPPQYTQPIRVLVNFDNLVNDPHTCYVAGSTRPPSLDGGTPASSICRDGDILTPDKRARLEELIVNSKNFFNHLLLVLPRTGNLFIDSSKIIGTQCDEIKIPPEYDHQLGGSGVDADYVLFVTSRPASSDQTLAYARFCQVEKGTPSGRPIVGIVNFAPYSIDTSEEGAIKQLGVVLHEITHALGFSASKFQSGFVRWANGSWVTVPSSEIKVKYYHPVIGHTVERIITPNTVQATRKHFGCPNLDGAELEDGGGPGTAGSHWEQRVFMNEYMTGTSVEFPVFSEITLSLFKDMGWYDYNSSHVKDLGSFLWGKNMGCDFVNGSCKKWPLTTEKEGYRCDGDTPRGQCRFDMLGWGHCNTDEINPLVEGCLFYTSTWQSSCDFDTKLFQSTLNAGEMHSNHSLCFHSSLAKLPGILPNFLRIPQAEIMQCYVTTCSGPDKLKLRIDDIWYDCPYEGGIIQPIDFGGEITCRPRAADLACVNADDDFTWPTVTRISPRKAKPGENITINGNHFNISNTTSLTVTIHVDCPYVYVQSNTELVVTLPPNEDFSSVMQMGLYSRRFSVVVKDEKGRTGHLKDALLIELQLDGSDIGLFFQDLGLSPAVTAIIAVIFLLVICAGFIFWCCKSWKLMERQHGNNSVKYSRIPQTE